MCCWCGDCCSGECWSMLHVKEVRMSCYMEHKKGVPAGSPSSCPWSISFRELKRGRYEEGGGAWKTNCSCTVGAADTGDVEKALTFNSKLVTLQLQKTQQPVVVPRHTVLGHSQPGREQCEPKQQPGWCHSLRRTPGCWWWV